IRGYTIVRACRHYGFWHLAGKGVIWVVPVKKLNVSRYCIAFCPAGYFAYLHYMVVMQKTSGLVNCEAQ
ncbi:MAG: hypothetical protein LAT84_14235, partial [Balneolia bacterium]|nr:hypothetical protein [Balneolia bacterium]